MLDTVVVMGMTVTAVEVVKNMNAYKNHKGMGKKILPFIILGTGCVFQILNNGVFGTGWDAQSISDAAKSGIEASVLYAGIYGMGKSSMQTTDPDIAQNTKPDQEPTTTEISEKPATTVTTTETTTTPSTTEQTTGT